MLEVAKRFLLLFSLFTTTVHAAEEAPAMLNLYSRPPTVVAAISKAFDRVQQRKGYWLVNENPEYGICDVNFERILQAFASGKKNINVLDFGAGKGTWAALARKLLLADALPSDVSITIFNITGDGSPGENKVEQIGQCFVIIVHGYKLENFKPPVDTGSGTPITFDLIVSQSTFQHFVDPVGTLMRLYNSLEVGGILAVVSLILYADRPYFGNNEIIRLLHHIGAPWILGFNHDRNFQNPFVLRKTTLAPVSLPLSYKEDPIDPNLRPFPYNCGPAWLTDTNITRRPERPLFFAENPDLFHFLLSNGLFRSQPPEEQEALGLVAVSKAL